MTKPKKIFLIDSYAIIFRSYYAFINNPMRNAKGMNTSTVFGFTLALDEIIKKENPSHIIAAFDASGPTFRHEMYKEYKANRDATPEDIKEAVPYIKELLKAYKIPIVELLGYEADDIIGTLAKQAEKEGFEVYMMTPDKDYAQLVSEKIFMYKPGRSGNPHEVLGIPEVQEKFSVETPEQLIDILALWGDSSDNIPGAPGVGEKTAIKLIQSFGSVEGIYENIDQLKGKQKEKLQEFREQVNLSKVLATIVLDVPLDFNLDSSIREEMDKESMDKLFTELNFTRLRSRILGEIPEIKPKQSDAQGSLFDAPLQVNDELQSSYDKIDSIQHDYMLIQDTDSLSKLIADLNKEKEFCFDTETTGLDVISAELLGISVSWKAHEAYYVDMKCADALKDNWVDSFKTLFAQEDVLVIGQNLKYDLHILKNYNIEVGGTLFDTMVAHYLLYPERKHGIDPIALDLLSYEKIKTEELIGKRNANQLSFAKVDIEKVKDYACEDADITWQLYLLLKDQLQEAKLSELAENIEMPLVKVLLEMEHHGVVLDTKVLGDFAHALREDLIQTEEKIFTLAGQTFNISSPKQLGEILFDKMKIVDNAKKTKTKQYSTSEEVLSEISDKHEIVQEVLNYRSLKKLLSTYVEALPKLLHPKTNKLHTSFNQTLVATGRLSSNNPNLQNIPIREERGREIRKAFTASEGNVFLSADYSQIELRLMAHLSQDEHMIQAFLDGEDIHTATAAKVFGVELQDVSREMRSKAKTANFGIIYGISAYGLSQRMKISNSEAKELIDGYFMSYPAVKAYMDKSIENAREYGFVETMFGRKRSLPDILSRNSTVRGNAERNAINAPIQGSAADIVKIAMVSIQNAFKSENIASKMIIQVHDELNFDVKKEELEKVKDIVKNSMESAVKLLVPLEVDMDAGANWLEAH